MFIQDRCMYITKRSIYIYIVNSSGYVYVYSRRNDGAIQGIER
jgi:hypothetical protein